MITKVLFLRTDTNLNYQLITKIQGSRMQILNRIFSHATKILILTTFWSITLDTYAQEKPASLIVKESFGSDPYNQIAYHDGTIIVSGKDGTNQYHSDGSRNLDILQYTKNGFEIISQFSLSKTNNDATYTSVLDLVYHNGSWLILANSSAGYYLLSASVANKKLVINNELNVSIPNNDAKLIPGANNNLYLVSSAKSLAVTHFTIDSQIITQKNTVKVGVDSGNRAYRNRFTASYDNQALYLTSNQDSSPAGMHKLPLASDGSPQTAITLEFEDAQPEYYTSKVAGDLWFLPYNNWKFHIARIEGNTLKTIYKFNVENFWEKSNWLVDIKIKGNLVYGIGRFGRIDVFEIKSDDTIVYRSSYQTKGELSSAQIIDDKLFFSRGWNGIEAVQINITPTLTRLNSLNQSGQVLDMAKQNNEIAVAALDYSLHFWQLDNPNKASLETTFTANHKIQGVGWSGHEIALNIYPRFTTHQVDNLKNNIDIGSQYSQLGTTNNDGQLIKLTNGYVAHSYRTLSFIDESNYTVSTIKLELELDFTSLYIQKMVAHGNLLFVPLLKPSEVIIYDTSDLTNVTEVSRIKRKTGIRGNVAIKGNYLFTPSSDANGIVITSYDITNPSNPKKLVSTSLGIKGKTAILHVVDNFLMAITDKGTLFDISNPEKPVLIEDNFDVSTNGIGKGFDKELYTVPRNSAGILQRLQVNLAPKHANLSIEVLEDETVTKQLSPTDNENDNVTFSVIAESKKGHISIQDNTTLIYEGSNNENGTDTAQLLVTDTFGGASKFDVTFNITPVNDAPIIETSEFNALEDAIANISLTATDIDSDTLTYSIITSPKFGSGELSKDGTLLYTPKPDYNGKDTIEVQVTDNEGATGNKIININVMPFNDAPIFTGEIQKQGKEDSNLTFDLSASDIDSKDITFKLVSIPNNWTSTLDDNQLQVTPKANDNGDFSIIIAVSDGQITIEQTLSVALTPVNDKPIFDNKSVNISVVSGQSQNSALAVKDIDGDTLTFKVSKQGSKGNASVNKSGAVTYTANPDTTGVDSFVITVSDEVGETASKEITVNISEAPASGGGGGSLNWLYLCALLLIAVQRRVKK